MDDAGKAAIFSSSSLFGWHTVLATKLYAAPAAPSPEMKPGLVAGGAPAPPSPPAEIDVAKPWFISGRPRDEVESVARELGSKL